jgi:hypothetical protein
MEPRAAADRQRRTFDPNYHSGDWGIDVPRPTWAVWIGDNWRLNNKLTINYGLRWDDDYNVANPPDVVLTSIPIDNRADQAPRTFRG